MKRREFLKTSSLLGGIALASPELIQKQLGGKKKVKKVLILGAGFSGLAAAYALKKKGIQYQILEARNRIGGRVFSHNPEGAKDLVIELGAEWVGASHERVIALCKEFNLHLDNNQFDTHLSFEGKYSRAGEWSLSESFETFWKDKVKIWEAMTPGQKRRLDKQDWWRYLSNKGFSDRDILLRELADSTDFGESIRHTSAYAAFAEYAESSEKNEMDLKITGGNSQLAEKLAQAVGKELILTQHKAVQINQDVNGVKVICENGQSFSADRLICTVPLYALQKIKWNPGLPIHQLDAIQALQYARIGKFPVLFKERFWKEENFDLLTDSPAHYFYHATKNQAGSPGVLISYAIGEKADSFASMTKTQREDIILDALKPAFGDVRKYMIDSMMYYWGVDAYSKGAYAFYGKSQWFGIMPILKQSFQHIHFAGEHLADWQGFMEGAINSGEDAAAACLSI